MKRIILTLVGWAAMAATFGLANEIGYIEDFALARDRGEALKQLIPGTEDYYYYHCLHFQNIEQFDKVDELLAAWIKRYNYTAGVHEIQNRQALLTYNSNPQKSLEFIRKRLGIQFNHQRERLDRKPNLPTSLDQQLISRERLTEIALARHRNLQGFEDAALDWLATTDLDADRRRHLLERLQRPDHAGLAKLVVDDLNHKYSKGFGATSIHQQLLLSQLDECLRLQPNLLEQTNFVNVYLTKLHPNDDADWRQDANELEAYLDRLWSFVQRLAPAHNSLKAHVLYHRLVHDRSRGTYAKDRFMTYLKLPRRVGYIRAEYMKLEQNRRHPADLNQDFQSVTQLPIVGDDEPLVRSYLHHFFLDETTYKPYEEYVNDAYLKHNFAEAKVVNGLGEPEQWYSLLPPATYQALKERIDLDFAFTNQKVFTSDESVSLDLHVKNVDTLIVKVYQINTANFYRENRREVNTDVNLDGLVPNAETTHQYTEPPLRRVGRHFDFPALSKPGVYVIDFIGNGKSSRAVVRKGKLRHLVRTGTAGHVFTVLDERHRKVMGATLWMDGHEYAAEEDGTIIVPFSNQPGSQPIILSHDGFSSLSNFQQLSEAYSLVAGIYVDRESLLKRKKARVVVRPGLYLNETPVTLSVLENVSLVVTSTDLDGVETTKDVHGFELFEDRESLFEFQVPQRLARISFTVKAQVQNMSQNRKIDLAATETFSLNEIDRTDKVEDLHFSKIDGSYVLDLLGKTGEAKADRPVNLSLKHRDFSDAVNVTLQTDEAGRIALGELRDVDTVTATGPEGTSHSWPLLHDQSVYPRNWNGSVGLPIELPYLGAHVEPDRAELSLLELRGGNFVADRFRSLSIENGMLRIAELPRGDYDLLLKDSGHRVQLRITEGDVREGYALGQNRYLQMRDGEPLQIEAVDDRDSQIAIRLRNWNEFTRVHVFATRYQPAFAAFGNLSRVRGIEPLGIPVNQLETLYVEGRDLGDEYRYIIDRQYAQKFPGNMLERPSLLLNPWPIRNTETGQQRAQEGEDFEALSESITSTVEPDAMQRQGLTGEHEDFANLDFLADASAVLLNLVPDERGVVTVDADEIGPHQQLHVVAVDPLSTVYRTVSRPETGRSFDDLRLLHGLDPKSHYTQQKQVSVVKAGDRFDLPDITTSKFETYDSLARVYGLYLTLTANPNLAEFNFILEWPGLTPEEKRAKYSKYACHELSFFIYKKDPPFFESVVLPYLANKKDKTFLDQWLLGADLSQHVNPWEYSQLNVVERILLAQRIEGEQQYTSRYVKDAFDLIPPDVDRFNTLFQTAIKGSALDASDAFGLEAAVREAEANAKSVMAGITPLSAAAPAQASAGRRLGQLADMDAATEESLEFRDRMERAKKEDDKQLGERMGRGLARRARAGGAGADYFFDDARNRGRIRQLYRKLDKTQEWVENNYYRLPIEQQNADLVRVNAFWNDFARHVTGEPFYSPYLAEASGNFTEMALALAVLDIPFKSDEHSIKFDDATMTLSARSPMIVFHEQIEEASPADHQTPILVSQNFFRHGDRYQYVNNEKADKYVTDEFLVGAVYGCQIVVTNPTSSRQRLDLLLQVPVGAIPVSNGQYTRGVPIDLQPFHTQTVDYYFYFPAPGQFAHFPVQVARNEQLLAHADAVTLNVVLQPSTIDRQSWDYVSQYGSDAEVLTYLEQHNLQRLNLDKIAFRMANDRFFRGATDLLARRHVYNHTLWSYAIKHGVVPGIREYLQHSDPFVAQCGSYVDSPVLTIDPVARKSYQHMDYRPLVNARAHQLGRRRQILNDRFFAQYHALLKVLSYRRDMDDDELMSLTYYMLLQDRVEEATSFLARVNPGRLDTQLQHDYFTAYVNFYTDDQQLARDIAERYADYPIDTWRNAFANVAAHLDEVSGNSPRLVDEQDRTQAQTRLAASAPNFEFTVEDEKVRLDYQNLDQVQINYYRMDIELLFSRNPFVQQYSGQFSYIQPNETQIVTLPAGGSPIEFELPGPLHNQNVLVEITGGGQTKSQAYYANSMTVQLIENYGQLRVTSRNPGKPLPTVYVKVYAQMEDGSVQFYKDGYTDIRGRFDYTSLSTNELDHVSKLSLLVLSEKHGAVVREANPPKR